MRNKRAKALSLLLAMALCAGTLPAAAAVSFSDVPSTHWAAGYISYVADKGLFSGTSATTFSPDGKITQAQMSVVLGRYAKQDVENCSPWYQKGMDWASSNGIISTRQPDHQLTREEFADMMYRFAKYAKKDTSIRDGVLNGYVDTNGLSGSYAEAMRWAVSVGLITGTDATHLSPLNLIDRAQVATMLVRYDGDAVEQPAPALPEVTLTPAPTTTHAPQPSAEPSKPLSEAEEDARIIAVLKEIQEEYPTGTYWGFDSEYTTDSGVTLYACAGFAAMCVDRIFGRPLPAATHTVNDYRDLRIGDEITYINNQGEYHVAIVTGRVDNTGVVIASSDDDLSCTVVKDPLGSGGYVKPKDMTSEQTAALKDDEIYFYFSSGNHDLKVCWNASVAEDFFSADRKIEMVSFRA